MTFTDSLGELYRRSLPDAIRYPIGHARRSLVDAWVRLLTPGPPLPPRRLLRRVQMTPWVWEYLRIGRSSARAIIDAVGPGTAARSGERAFAPLSPDEPRAVLDFGCGLGRTLRHLVGTAWRLHGCDVDGEQVGWSAGALPEADLRTNGPEPPLPWEAESFDLCWAVSVFTHFDRDQQGPWADELARVLRPGGLAVITTMGPHAFGGFPNLATEERRRALQREGFVFHAGGQTFNSRGAFHTREGIEAIFGDRFELLRWVEGGLDGFQDLCLFRRRDLDGEWPEAIDRIGDRA